MRKFFYKVTYYPLWALWYSLSLLPLRVHYAFSSVFYFLVAHVFRYRRKVIMKNLRNAFPDKTEHEREQIANGFYHFFSDFIAETLKYGTMRRESIMRHMVVKNIEEVNRILESGQSVALFLGHYGNWEWVTSLCLWIINRDDIAMGQVYHPLENEAMDRVFLNVRNRMGSQCIAMRETLRWILNVKSKGWTSIVGYIADQVPTWENIHHWTTFMHQETPVFTGMERIARSQNQAVVYIDVKCVKRGYYELDMQVVTRDPKSLPENEITNECFRRLEATIERAPQYWLWSHNRWKRTREEFDRRYTTVNGRVVKVASPQPPKD